MNLRAFRGLVAASIVLACAVGAALDAAAQNTPPRPITPLDFSESDYPLESLVAGEQGDVTVELIVGSDGVAVDTTIVTSSGFPRLDAATESLATERWRFAPATENGNPAIGTVTVAAKWAFRELAQYKLMSDPQPIGLVAPKPTTSHAIVANDYPASSLMAEEFGTVALKYLVDATGSVSDVQIAASSGFPRLDAAATKVARRWKFEPAILNGMPVSVWQTMTTTFALIGPDPRKPKCQPAPVIGFREPTEEVLIVGELIHEIPKPSELRRSPWTWHDRWTEVDAGGKPINVILVTPKGPVLIPNNLLQRAGQLVTYPKPNAAGRCWYHDPFLTKS